MCPNAHGLARLMLAESTDALGPIPERLPQGIHGNNAAQAVELAWCLDVAVVLMEKLLAEKTGDLWTVVRAGAGVGTAVIEAPRRLLIDYYALDDPGRVAAADIVTPTAIYQSAMEEKLLADLRERGPDEVAELVERIVRAYDPCISCSVHLLNCTTLTG